MTHHVGEFLLIDLDCNIGFLVIHDTLLNYHQPQYNNVIMSAMASQISSLTIVYSSFIQTQIKKKTSKLRVTGLCEGNSPVTGEFRTKGQ